MSEALSFYIFVFGKTLKKEQFEMAIA